MRSTPITSSGCTPRLGAIDGAGEGDPGFVVAQDQHLGQVGHQLVEPLARRAHGVLGGHPIGDVPDGADHATDPGIVRSGWWPTSSTHRQPFVGCWTRKVSWKDPLGLAGAPHETTASRVRHRRGARSRSTCATRCDPGGRRGSGRSTGWRRALGSRRRGRGRPRWPDGRGHRSAPARRHRGTPGHGAHRGRWPRRSRARRSTPRSLPRRGRPVPRHRREGRSTSPRRGNAWHLASTPSAVTSVFVGAPPDGHRRALGGPADQVSSVTRRLRPGAADR